MIYWMTCREVLTQFLGRKETGDYAGVASVSQVVTMMVDHLVVDRQSRIEKIVV
jgi:hypothetical protein